MDSWLPKTRTPTIVVDTAIILAPDTADIQCPAAAMASISIFAMVVAIPPAPCPDGFRIDPRTTIATS
jgi:hypothetical protein